MADSGVDAIGLDWTVDISEARKTVGKKVSLQGNLDPQILMSNEKKIEKEVNYILESFGYGSGHIFNLGHGISQFTPPDHVNFLIECVHKNSKKFH